MNRSHAATFNFLRQSSIPFGRLPSSCPPGNRAITSAGYFSLERILQRAKIAQRIHMPKYRTILLILLASILWTAMPTPAIAASDWPETSIDGVSYIKVERLRAFYKFKNLQGDRGYYTIGSALSGKGNRFLKMKADSQTFYINNVHFELSHPVKRNAQGEYLISKLDIVKVIDPVLRPQYIKNAENVQTVIIDPGHGGHDAGATNSAAHEADLNLKVAKKLKALLVRAGFKVVMTREADIFLTLQERVNIANKYENAIFVSIHHNSSRGSSKGIETFTLAPKGTTSPYARTLRYQDLAGNSQDSTNIALATAVHSAAILRTGAEDRGIKRARFSVLCSPKHPAILFEGGFMSNPEEARLLNTDEYQQKLAECICVGIKNYKTAMGAKPGSVPAQSASGTRSGSTSSRRIGTSTRGQTIRGGTSASRTRP